MNMKMKMKASKKMGGFMCQSPGATAVVCMTGDHRSVIVPRRPDRTTMLDHHHHHHARLLKNTNYIRLGGSRNIAPPPPPPPAAPNKITTTLNNNIIIPSIGTSNSDIHHHEDDHKKHIQKIPTAQLAPSNQVFQVVVMRVSLHCQGCAGKLKKHLSKMEGVTSFSIDLETKRVTVMGHVSPVDVLESISKVKKAEFWSC